MCTLTIGRTDRSLLVTVNRDEARSREAELPPQVFDGDGGSPTQWIAPLDGRSGGTWIAANSRGVVACLLNRWPREPDPGEPGCAAVSRGQIIPDLIVRGELQQCWQWGRRRFELQRFKPFQLVIADLDQVLWATWRGAQETVPQALNDSDSLQFSKRTVPKEKWTLFCSSSHQPGRVTQWRKELFQSWLDASSPFRGHLPSLHLEQKPGKAGWGPLVDRRNVRTRSITQIEVSTHPPHADLRYWENPSDMDGANPSHQLSLPIANLAREAQGS